MQNLEELCEAHHLTAEEYERIKELLGREPNVTELGMFSVMWSEHCSYKSSKRLLALLPSEGKNVLVGAGEENAGCVSVGDGLALVFKMESHNHPSRVEPFQGAATGVGGILRDTFTMGARPVLFVNSLRFGDLKSPLARSLLKGVVAGISFYGNCVGVPTVGGEIYFDEAYEENPLVNVLCLGLVSKKGLARGIAKGVGNPVYYVGATTGRDGLGGASFASREITEESEEERPAVQVGDPFLGKLLMEACLEAIRTGVVVGIQDMGAAGLTCASSETASRGKRGMELDLDQVPRRASGMTPYEVMLSESQERMLLIVRRGREGEIKRIFEKWDLHAVKVGEVREGGLLRILAEGKVAAEVPTKALVEEAPLYEPGEAEPGYLKETQSLDLHSIEQPVSYNEVLRKLLGHPNIASKEWVYRQYDHMVRTDSVFLPGHDAALVRIKGTKKAIAVSTDCNSLYCYLDPYEGAKLAVCEAARNVVCVGARPVGITDCLNFGNPMKPEVFWTFRRAIEGIRDAAQFLEIPVTGGNVSFYNESHDAVIPPTPTIGVAGLLDDIELRVPSFFQSEGDLICLLGETGNDLGGSHYLWLQKRLRKGRPPRVELEREKKLQGLILEAAAGKLLKSCHDLSEGGLAVGLAECGFGRRAKPLGVEIDRGESAKAKNVRVDAFLFGESPSRVLVSLRESDVGALSKLTDQWKVSCYPIGHVGGSRLRIGDWIHLEMGELESIYRDSLAKQLETV